MVWYIADGVDCFIISYNWLIFKQKRSTWNQRHQIETKVHFPFTIQQDTLILYKWMQSQYPLPSKTQRLLTRSSENIAPTLRHTHWLPILQNINFKILLITCKALDNLTPEAWASVPVASSYSQILPAPSPTVSETGPLPSPSSPLPPGTLCPTSLTGDHLLRLMTSPDVYVSCTFPFYFLCASM